MIINVLPRFFMNQCVVRESRHYVTIIEFY